MLVRRLGQAQVGWVGGLAAAAVRLRADRELATDRTRLASLFAAALLGLQLAANYWDFLYLAWVVPLVALTLCQP